MRTPPPAGSIGVPLPSAAAKNMHQKIASVINREVYYFTLWVLTSQTFGSGAIVIVFFLV